MKILSLNIWGGGIREPLLDFIRSHQETDVLCLQEVYHNASARISTGDDPVTLDIFAQVQEALPHHIGHFQPVVGTAYGLAVFVRKTRSIVHVGAVSIHENPDYAGLGPAHDRLMQWVQLEDLTVCNVHGLWNGKGKGDSPARLSQSAKIKKSVAALPAPVVLCGDFNLQLDTRSVKILEESLDNLIRCFGVTDTRTRYYPKAERMADYFFVTPSLAVDSFGALPDEVSDHAPLLLHLGATTS